MKRNIICLISACLLIFAICCSHAAASEKWPGVDESVVEKYAAEHGREASEPLINTDQGDLLLFVFLLAGTAGGFAAGYFWSSLLTTRSSNIGRAEQRQI